MQTATAAQRAARLLDLAGQIRDNVFIAHHIADAFELIAGAMTPCYDCGEAAKPAAVEEPVPVTDAAALGLPQTLATAETAQAAQ